MLSRGNQCLSPPLSQSPHPGTPPARKLQKVGRFQSKTPEATAAAPNFLLQPREDPAEWEELQASWIKEYDGHNSPAALTLAIHAAEARWAIIRARNAFDRVQYEISAEQRACCLWTEQHHKRYARFQRHFTAADRAFRARS